MSTYRNTYSGTTESTVAGTTSSTGDRVQMGAQTGSGARPRLDSLAGPTTSRSTDGRPAGAARGRDHTSALARQASAPGKFLVRGPEIGLSTSPSTAAEIR